MVTNIATLDLSKLYSYADYLTWQVHERLELIKGKIFKMAPAPTRGHQKTSGEISYQVRNHLRHKSCEIYTAPFDVRFPKEETDNETYTVVQPDICIICDPNKLDDRGCVGAPDLIIEILSPSTAAKDATVKFELYQEQGVKEYWMVHPYEQLVDVYLLDENGKYQFIKTYTREHQVKVNIFDDFYLDLSAVFPEEEPQQAGNFIRI